MSAKWLGERTCDFCNASLDHAAIDGRTTRGPWAVMCFPCFKREGIGLGLGMGQLYIRNEEGELELVTGGSK